MNNDIYNNACEFAAEIVPYLYNETDATGRGRFESHMADCTACTDEFAGISSARYSVFEWQKEEFAHLATPEIVIPYGAEQRVIASAGFFAELRELLTLSGWPSAVAVAGVLTISLGLGFLAINYFGDDQQIAQDVNRQVVPPVVQQNTPLNPISPDIISGQETTTAAASKATSKRETVRISMDNRQSGNTKASTMQKLINNVANRHPTQQTRKAPVLNAYDDDDDKSLRLADLVDEVGAKR